MQVKLVRHGAGDVDVSVLAPQVIFGADYKLTLTLDGVIFGEDLYFLGFPYGLGMEGETNFNANFPVPLLKKAVVSGSKEDGAIFLDGHNSPGFSGGPVARRGTKVVSGYRYDTHHVLDERGNQTPYTYSTNTGIVIAHNIKQALEIIEKNRIGERVD